MRMRVPRGYDTENLGGLTKHIKKIDSLSLLPVPEETRFIADKRANY